MEAQKEKVAAIQAANDQAWAINKEAKEIDESRAKKVMRQQLMVESSKITDQNCQEGDSIHIYRYSILYDDI